jgi:GNAT superfamily N-acetyltransferase
MIALSPLDEQRFGVRTARAGDLTLAGLPEALRFCERERVRFLIARCSTTDLPLVHELESQGFQLMDTLVYYKRQLGAIPKLPDPESFTVRPAMPEEADSVRKIAEQAFQDYQGHYHADPRLDRRLCDETYVDWAWRSCSSRELADEVLVAAGPNGLAGFSTMRLIAPGQAEGVLACVSPEAQVPGLYLLLMIRTLEWARSKGAKSIVFATQITNLAVQKIWSRLGCEPWESFYTFHRWFDRG